MTAPAEHDFEPMPGLPQRLPEDEYILWQGRPDWKALALHALHTRALAIYFALIVLWRLATGLYDGDPFWSVAISIVVFCTMAAVAIGLFELFAWLVYRTTLYTITNQRIVMRIGVVLSMTVNLPFSAIASAGIRRYEDGTGTIALTLKARSPFSWMVLWPHARPWHFSAPQPALRLIPEVDRVGAILADALACALSARRDEESLAAEARAKPVPAPHRNGARPARARPSTGGQAAIPERLQGAAG